MNLHQLVDFRNSLRSNIKTDSIHTEIKKLIKTISDISAHSLTDDFKQTSNKIIESYNNLLAQVDAPLSDIDQMLNQVQEKISQQSQQFFTDSYAVELEIIEKENLTQNLRDRRHWRNIRLNDDDSPDKHMLGIIQKNCSYQYPVLEIGCRDGEWTKHMIAGDPLYVSEYTEEFMHNAVHQFTKQYVPRVRRYQIKDNTIEGLPENQFGFIFSYNFFNYLAFDTIKEWMRKVHTWLRPGGVIMFTYNNADFGYGASMAESSVQSYCPMSLLVPMCESIGFEYYAHKDYADVNSYNPFSWIQFKKSGELSTIKVAQALGQIKLYSES